MAANRDLVLELPESFPTNCQLYYLCVPRTHSRFSIGMRHLILNVR